MRDGRKTSPLAAQETRRCAVYTRKSTSAGLEQDFNSLDAQREACVAYIQHQPGWTLLPDRYDDGGFTGANIERPSFQRLLADIDGRRVDIVVVYKVDRLSRSLLDFARLMERFNRAGASFVSVTQNFSTADAMGRLTLNMLMSFAEFEREMIGERTRDKIAGARRRGKWTGGQIPLGYDVQGKGLVVNETEAPLVREAFVLYLEQRSALAVTRLLNDPTRSPGPSSLESREDPPKLWNKAEVLRLLRNPLYAGYMRSRGELYEAEHKALVDRRTFQQVGALLGRARRGSCKASRNPSRNPDYLLRGLLRCGCCGSAFVGASSHKGRKVLRYYRCSTRDRRGREACPSPPLPAAAIEEYAVERLREYAAGRERTSLGVGSSWVSRCLADFDSIWDVLTPENRVRLLRAVVQSVEVDEPANRIKVTLQDPGDGTTLGNDDKSEEVVA
jgi:site-specific DNA recombinase